MTRNRSEMFWKGFPNPNTGKLFSFEGKPLHEMEIFRKTFSKTC